MTKNKKVVMILSNPFKPDPRVYKEARSLVKNGFDVTIVAWDRECKYPPYEIVEGIKIQRIPLKAKYGNPFTLLIKLPLFYILAALKITKMDFDIIHTHDFDTAVVGFLFKTLKNKKWIFDIHDIHSPDADDIFMYYAIKFGWISGDYDFKNKADDIETLNQQTLAGLWDVSAISFALYPHIADQRLFDVLLNHALHGSRAHGGVIALLHQPQPRFFIDLNHDLTLIELRLQFSEEFIRHRQNDVLTQWSEGHDGV
jgi:hypothetical protein